MPLPNHGPLTLQAHSGVGDAVQSKPKKAMIVRMSAETLDALEAFPNQPKMEFQFGQKPGIYIGEAFFPMNPQKENAPHELYLRVSTTAKPIVPLKLYANVTGKFTVQRELDEKMEDKVRDRTLTAEKQRTERKAIYLDTPPEMPSINPKKRKAQSTMSGKAPLPDSRVSSSVRVPTPSSQTHIRSPSTSADTELRKQLIHFLAKKSCSEDEVVRSIGGIDYTSSLRQDLLAILYEVAEQIEPPKKAADASNRPWRLKARTWLEVRPYEWPSLSEPEKTSMARQARMALQSMRIPESDAAWNHVKYRSSGTSISITNPPLPSTRSASEPSTSKPTLTHKRGLSLADAKHEKSKVKVDAGQRSGMVPVEDNGVKASKNGSAPKGQSMEDKDSNGDDTPLKSKLAVRGSGAGSTVKADTRPSSVVRNQLSPKPPAGRLGSHLDQKHRERGRSLSPLPHKTISRARSDDEKRANPAFLSSSNPEKGKEPAADIRQEMDLKNAGRIPKKRPEGVADPNSDRERVKQGRIPKNSLEAGSSKSNWEQDRRMEAGKQGIEREREKGKGREPEDKSLESRGRDKGQDGADHRHAPAASLKRKKPTHSPDGQADDSESYANKPRPHKKGRADDSPTPIPSSSIPSRASLDLSLPKKPEVSPAASALPRQRIKKESSSLPPKSSSSTAGRTAVTSPSSSQHLSKNDRSSAKANGTVKSRRRSPRYTSSEDEGEIHETKQRDMTMSNRAVVPPDTTESKPIAPRAEPGRSSPLPSDHATLRARYQNCWQEYIRVYSKVVAEKHKIEALLSREIGTDSEGDIELVDGEELRMLSAKHTELRSELLAIKKLWGGESPIGDLGELPEIRD